MIKEAKNLKDSKEVLEREKRRKGCFNYVIISKNVKDNKKLYLLEEVR